MHFHSNAALNLKQREQIKSSFLSCRAAAHRYAVSPATAHRWKHRSQPQDASCRPHRIHYALHAEEIEMALSLRRRGLSLDDLFDALTPVLPHLRRATLHRLLVRHGLNRLQPKTKTEHGVFKDYAPGFLHVDCFKLPKLTNADADADDNADDNAARYCFVAIDRATRLLLLWVYPDKTKESATDFLRRCLDFFPFKIEKLLTDNGREFTLAGFKNRWGTKLKPTTKHPFEQLCQDHQIEHRRTKPYTPKTNGLVERANRLIKDNTIKVHRYPNRAPMVQDLRQWNTIYNFCRPHRRIGRITPYQAVCNWYLKQPQLFIRKPTHLLQFRSQPPET